MALFDRLPRAAALFAGSALGWVVFHVQRKDEFRAERHLRAAFPGRFSNKQNRALIKRTFISAGLSACDTVRLRNHYQGELAELIDVSGLEYFDEMYHRGKGVIAATGHIGNFELLAAFFGRNGYKTAAIGRKLYQSKLDDIIVQNRLANQVLNIPTTEIRKMLRSLHEGFAIGVLIDNDSTRVAGEFVESYGRLANTPIGPVVLGMRAGAAFMPLCCLREGARYHLKFFPEETPLDFGDSAEGRKRAAIELSWRIRKILDEQIASHPEQWLWTHNRWHTRPEAAQGIPFGATLFQQKAARESSRAAIVR
jgi:KDO2-lipid IV(A) lauroyltransferase